MISTVLLSSSGTAYTSPTGLAGLSVLDLVELLDDRLLEERL